MSLRTPYRKSEIDFSIDLDPETPHRVSVEVKFRGCVHSRNPQHTTSTA